MDHRLTRPITSGSSHGVAEVAGRDQLARSCAIERGFVVGAHRARM
ncbi:MAG TPA: hypothetical protein VFT22_33820 [Kofleriaceae bacterium]|nr:hypothetical protein [Kofleriaceae bacterium]